MHEGIYQHFYLLFNFFSCLSFLRDCNWKMLNRFILFSPFYFVLLPLFFLQPLHRELYNIHPATFFVPSFIKAIGDNTIESFRSIISEPSPGIFTFSMLQPSFCELLLSEVSFIFLLAIPHFISCHFDWALIHQVFYLGWEFWKVGPWIQI